MGLARRVTGSAGNDARKCGPFPAVAAGAGWNRRNGRRYGIQRTERSRERARPERAAIQTARAVRCFEVANLSRDERRNGRQCQTHRANGVSPRWNGAANAYLEGVLIIETAASPVFITPTARGWNLLRARDNNGTWNVRLLQTLDEAVALVTAEDNVVLSLPVSAVLAQRFR